MVQGRSGTGAITLSHAAAKPLLGFVPPLVLRRVEVSPADTLRTARLTLRPLRESDRAEFLRVIRAGRLHLADVAGLFRPGESDEALFARELDVCRRGEERGDNWRRVAFLDDGRLAGAFTLTAITHGLTFEADATWWTALDQARQGLATEAVSAMLDLALAEWPAGLGLHRVHAAIRSTDVASLRLAQRVGLRRVAQTMVSIRLGGEWRAHELWERRIRAA